MQRMAEQSSQDIESLKRRVQHLEEEIGRMKMKMTGKRWL
jgi:hypothetical protein